MWNRSSNKAGLLFAIAIVAFGVEHIVCVRFRAFNNTIYSGHEVVSVIPWVPGYQWLGYLTGLVLIATGRCIVANVKARPPARSCWEFCFRSRAAVNQLEMDRSNRFLPSCRELAAWR